MPPGLTPAEIDAIVSAEGAQGRSLYFVDYDRLQALEPSLVVLQDLCRVCAIDSPTLARDMSRLNSAPQVVSLGAHSLEGVFSEIELLGGLTGRLSASQSLTASLRSRVERVTANATTLASSGATRRVLCLEWLDPPFTGGHWVPEMVELAGGHPVLASPGEKSVRVTWQQIAASDPELIVLMPCGYDLPQTLDQFRSLTLPPEWHSLKAVQTGEVYAVNGSAYFSRPGPRLVDGLEILAAILIGTGDERFTKLPAQSVSRI
jgi:iron complex transport system substrate-binding protein